MKKVLKKTLAHCQWASPLLPFYPVHPVNPVSIQFWDSVRLRRYGFNVFGKRLVLNSMAKSEQIFATAGMLEQDLQYPETIDLQPLKCPI